MKDFNSIGKTVGGNEGNKCHYPTRLDTYGCGCQHDCSYCYAKSLLDFRKLWNPQAPSVGSIATIAKEVRKDKELAHIQITVTTLDNALYLAKGYEKASLPTERVAAILTLQQAGYDVSLRLSPFIPEFVDIDQLNGLGINKILVEFLRVNAWIEKWFDIDYSPYTINENGYKHLPLARKKELISRITGFKEITVCEDETTAYNYWKEHVNNNPEDCCNLRTKE